MSLRPVSSAGNPRDLAFDEVYSSPLIRAVRTAEIIAPKLQPIIDERLIEMEYGPYEGKSFRPVPLRACSSSSYFSYSPLLLAAITSV